MPPGDLTPEENRFVDEVVEGLAEQDQIIPVRLALFVEMIKDRSWLPATLAGIGGMEGIGVAFLEDSFSSKAALPEHRLHQQAAGRPSIAHSRGSRNHQGGHAVAG